MTETFVSPQTGSRYVKVNQDSYMFVGARYLGGEDFRITIRCEDLGSDLMTLPLPHPPWSDLKDNDHISTVVQGVEQLRMRVNEAIEAVRQVAGIGSMNAEWFNEVAEDHPEVAEDHQNIVSMDFDEDENAPETTVTEFLCPHCGTEITAVYS